MPGTPLIHNLHLKAKVRFPNSLFLLYCSSVTSKKKEKKKTPKTKSKQPQNQHQQQQKSQIRYEPQALCPPPVRKRFKKILQHAQCSVTSSNTNDSRRNSTARQTRYVCATLQMSLTIHRDFSITPPPQQSPTAPHLKPALKSEKVACPRDGHKYCHCFSLEIHEFCKRYRILPLDM